MNASAVDREAVAQALEALVVVIAHLDMPNLKPTGASTLEGAAVVVAERHRDGFHATAGFHAAAGFEFIPGIELDCSGAELGEERIDGEIFPGVPSGGFVHHVIQIGCAADGTPLLKMEDHKSGKLPGKGDETVHDQLRIYVLMIEKLTGIRPQQPRARWRPAEASWAGHQGPFG